MTRTASAAARSVVKRRGWLAEMPASFADALLDRYTLKSAKRGDCICRMDDAVDGLRGVVFGGFALEIAPHQRGPHLCHIFRPGFWFGEAELFDERPKFSTVIATRHSAYFHLSHPDLKQLAEDQPETWRWIGLLAAQHQIFAFGIIDDFMLRNPGKRIAALLLRLTDVRDSDEPDDPRPELHVTQNALAEMATLSRATIVGHLGELEQAGLIARAYGGVTLLDPARLRRYVDEEEY